MVYLIFNLFNIMLILHEQLLIIFTLWNKRYLKFINLINSNLICWSVKNERCVDTTSYLKFFIDLHYWVLSLTLRLWKPYFVFSDHYLSYHMESTIVRSLNKSLYVFSLYCIFSLVISLWYSYIQEGDWTLSSWDITKDKIIQ